MAASLIYLVLLVAGFFFFLVRPQRRQAMAHKALVDGLRSGEAVVLSSGIHGTIHSLDDDDMRVEIAKDVIVTVARGAVSRVVSPPGLEDPARVDPSPGSNGN